MTKEKAAREFRKHWRKAMKLKEGGKAWEREMAQCDRYQEIAIGDKVKEIKGYDGNNYTKPIHTK